MFSGRKPSSLHPSSQYILESVLAEVFIPLAVSSSGGGGGL